MDWDDIAPINEPDYHDMFLDAEIEILNWY